MGIGIITCFVILLLGFRCWFGCGVPVHLISLSVCLVGKGRRAAAWLPCCLLVLFRLPMCRARYGLKRGRSLVSGEMMIGGGGLVFVVCEMF